MQNINIKVNSETYLGDLQTPVGIYLKIRDLYVESVLLESSDYNSTENSMSYVAFKPLASFVAQSGEITMTFPGGEKETVSVKDKNTLPDTFQEYIKKFCVSDADKELGANGFFGYSSYEAIQYFEDIKLSAERKAENKVPEVNYVFYKYIIAFNHYKNEIKIIENLLPGETETQIPKIIGILNNPIVSEFRFELDGDEQSDITDEEFKAMVRKGKENCYKGNVFQIVLSRRFSQGYKGDDMMLYRKLRSINPSPYLFYFDFGSFRIFGSSPEVHLMVKDNKAYIMPIAGTMRRTGNIEEDKKIAEKLLADPKENAEHIMLVDLARNDLSRNTDNVRVEQLRTVQYYSHVIHLVSSVAGDMPKNVNLMKLFADTFPAGTLSGAPKVKAMQLIDEIERYDRGFYGGCIGFIGLNGTSNQAITIRSFLSRDNRLYYQAGAGVVAKSNEESELQEVNNKLAALRNAMNVTSSKI